MKNKIITAIVAIAVVVAAFAFNSGSTVSAGEEVKLPILMYHHVSKQSARWNDYVISVEELEADMEYLSRGGWTSISIRNLLDYYEGNFEMPEKPFMITFDDAFYSTLEYAQPVLERYGFCGVVAAIGSIAEKYSIAGEREPEFSHLSWEGLREIIECGNFEVQCHTWDMHSLSPSVGCSKSRSETESEYVRSLSSDLSKYLTQCKLNGVDTMLTIAYPYGAYSEATTQVVRDMGFGAAFTCDEHINTLTGDEDELFALARFNRPHGISTERFFEKWEKEMQKSA